MTDKLPADLSSSKIAFAKNAKAVGCTEFKAAGNEVKLYTSEKSSAGRAAILKQLVKLVGGKYITDGRAGYILLGKAKIYMKPTTGGATAGLVLKPTFISKSLADVEIPFAKYYTLLHNAVKDHPTLTQEQKGVLLALVDHTIAPSVMSTQLLKKQMKMNGSSLPINTINNDFGELLGPIAVVNGLMPIDRRTASVFVPARSNEPLLDYRVTDKNGVYKISAKSGDSTNTLKPADVYKLISDEKKLLKKYQGTDQLEVVKILADNTWREGPIKALAFLKSKKYPSAQWLKKAEYTENVRQESEKSLVNISKNELDFTKMFLDATNAKIHYVKFRLDAQGTVKWEKVDHEKKSVEKRVVFRSKNFEGRQNGDKLGFQV